MSTEVLVPILPESVADATLVAWHKSLGDIVAKDENLVDLETDKIVLEVPAPESGVLKAINQPNGATVTSGEILAVIEESMDTVKHDPIENSVKVQEPQPQQQYDSNPPLPLSPAVRRLILENDLDPTLIDGSGKEGRLTKTDVLTYLDKRSSSPARLSKETPIANVPLAVQNKEIETSNQIEDMPTRPEQRVPMTRLRARVAERLIQAQQNAAMLTTFNEVNLQMIMELRGQYQAQFEKKHGIKLGLMSFFVKATIEALKSFPVINASIDEQDVIYHGYYDIGIAVSTDRGLVVPILRDADMYDFASIEKAIADFGIKAREGKLSYEDLSGGTFTISNGGIFGSMLSTPILNPPQSAILGMHAIQKRPIADNNQIVIRPMMYLALTYDHRIIDGREAVQFIIKIKEYLEDPARLLLSI